MTESGDEGEVVVHDTEVRYLDYYYSSSIYDYNYKINILLI